MADNVAGRCNDADYGLVYLIPEFQAPMNNVPEIRIQRVNDRAIKPNGDYVLYWMIANRRTRHNFSLDRAVSLCVDLAKPLLIFEGLRCGYQWASDRLHRFVIQGMAANRDALKNANVTYYPWLEQKPGDGSGLLNALAEKACVVITDDFPCFFLPRMVTAAAAQLSVQVEAIDSNGLYPLRATDRVFTRAHSFRRALQKEILPHLDNRPMRDPMRELELPKPIPIPKEILDRWHAVDDETLELESGTLDRFAIDHDVRPASFDGGSIQAAKVLDRFFAERYARYGGGRNDPDDAVASGLSPYLHFGHISAHEIFERIIDVEQWDASKVAEKPNGSRSGWWGFSETAESFIDELLTWRELGYNMTSKVEGYDQFDSLPEWSLRTISEHAADPRETIYTDDELESASTDDEIWNAAQRELVRTGRMHNYLRMLWGKKIYQWSPTAQGALRVMIHLNNKYAVDGRNPNSYSGIFWVLGRYDRAWGPERPIFGKLRYMTSDSTRRKLKLKEYLKRFGADSQQTMW